MARSGTEESKLVGGQGGWGFGFGYGYGYGGYGIIEGVIGEVVPNLATYTFVRQLRLWTVLYIPYATFSEP